MLEAYLKHGYGDCKLYNTSFFCASLNDETALLTLAEFAEKAVDFNDVRWMDKTDNACIDELLGDKE